MRSRKVGGVPASHLVLTLRTASDQRDGVACLCRHGFFLWLVSTFAFMARDFDPSEITMRLGLAPTLMFRPGDPILADGRGVRRHSGWMIKVGGEETLKIDGMLNELRTRVSVPGDDVRKLCSDLNLKAVVLCGVGQDAEETPHIEFPADFVAWVSAMGAAIEVDVML